MQSDSAPANPADTYQAYFVPAMFTPWAKVLLDYAKPQPGERVLDVACGTGVVTRTVAPMVGVSGSVVGLDVNPAMLAVARTLPTPADGAPIEWREESALAMTLPDASFDLVLCQQGLQFFPDKATGVREMRRVLKPGGRAVVACWHPLDRQGAFNALIQAEARHLNMPIEPLSVPFSLGDGMRLCALFTDAGFEEVGMSEHTMVLRFPQPDRYVQLSIQSAAAAIPALGQMDAPARAQLADVLSQELREAFRPYTDGDYLATPTNTHFVVAR